MPSRALLPVALGALLALVLAACGERSEPLGALAAPYPVTVQTGETTVTVTSLPKRIVAVDTGSADFVEALGATEQLVGIPSGSSVGVSDAQVIVTATGRIQVGPIAELGPDIIIAADDTDPVELDRLKQRLGVPVYVRPSRTVDDVVRAAFDLGELLGVPVKGRQLADDLRKRVDEVGRRLAGVAAAPVFADTGFFQTPPAGSLFRDILERGGGQIVPEDTTGGFAASPAEIAAGSPQVYFATTDSRVTLRALQSDDVLGGTPAALDGRLVVLDTADTVVAGPETVDVLEAVAAAIHPDVFG